MPSAGPTPRALILAVPALGLLAVLSGDRAITATSSGIDPLEVLEMKVRPNAILVLDSSGSMREAVDTSGLVSGISNGELVGDDPNARLYQAKQVLKTVVAGNYDRVSFQLGRYAQAPTNTAATGVALNDRFYYVSTQGGAKNVEINPNGNGASFPGAKRALTDNYTVDGVTYYYLVAGRFWNGETIDASTNVITPGPKTNPPTVRIKKGSASATFTFVGVNWIRNNDPALSCSGFHSLVALAACDATTTQVTALDPHLDREVALAADGSIPGYVDGLLGAPPLSQPALGPGIRAVGGTPLARTLRDIRKEYWDPLWTGTIQAQSPKQMTFVVLVTDGDDQCGPASEDDTDQGPNGNLDQNALAAAYQAELLYKAKDPAEPASSVRTFVVAFGGGASLQRAHWIAWGGSGMSVPNDGKRWLLAPTAADRAACKACVDALPAKDALQLEDAMEAAIDQGANQGTFSAAPTVTESLYELAHLAPLPSASPPPPAASALDPATRYRPQVPVLLQASFELPGFRGHVRAYRNDGADVSTLLWDAGQRLADQVQAGMAGGPWTFAQLHGGATPQNIATSSAKIKRRILTTTRNGVFTPAVADLLAGTAQSSVVSLWPPAANVSNLDDALGLTSSGSFSARFFALQDEFGACAGANLPQDCTSGSKSGSEPDDKAYNEARREARQMVLAFLAGAEVVRAPDGTPYRNPTDKQLRFQARPWVLAETTLAAPAVVSVPPDPKPAVHESEYGLYRDGLRNSSGVALASLAYGFGLRHPDRDGTSASTANLALKPVMSVAYVATNAMLHAFRAAACPPAATTCTGDNGGEELWAFVPFDQLGKQKERMKPQQRKDHTFSLSSSLRFADVFVPGAFTLSAGTATASGQGVWRTLLLFGRGPGGSSYTALDVTAPAAFTARALQARLPFVYWSRGNPDTSDGKPKAGSNLYNEFPGATDHLAYAKMGETWSVPAIARVDPALNLTVRRPAGVEFAAYVGSGYSDKPGEGTTFYALDVLNGDVIAAHDVEAIAPSSTPFFPENALPGSPVVHLAAVQSAGFKGNVAGEQAVGGYFPDLAGRLWRFQPDLSPPSVLVDLAADGAQPIATSISLARFSSDGQPKPHLYVEAGSDRRVPTPQDPPRFRMYAFRDEGLGTAPALLFQRDFPAGFRGTVPPALAFSASGNLRVFYAGVRLAQAGCSTEYQSILYALDGIAGNAAYDLSSGGDDSSATLDKQHINSVRVSNGRLVVDTGLGAGQPPPAGAPAWGGPPPPDSKPSEVFLREARPASAVCK